MSGAQANASMHTVLSGMLSRLRSPNRRTPRVVMTGRNAASFLSKVGLECPPNVSLFRHVDSSRPIGHVPLCCATPVSLYPRPAGAKGNKVSFRYLVLESKRFITNYQFNNTKATISQGAVITAIATPTTRAFFTSKCR